MSVSCLRLSPGQNMTLVLKTNAGDLEPQSELCCVLSVVLRSQDVGPELWVGARRTLAVAAVCKCQGQVLGWAQLGPRVPWRHCGQEHRGAELSPAGFKLKPAI